MCARVSTRQVVQLRNATLNSALLASLTMAAITTIYLVQHRSRECEPVKS